MLRARTLCAYTGTASLCTRSSGGHLRSLRASGSGPSVALVPILGAIAQSTCIAVTTAINSTALTEQRRFSFKYAKKSQMDEMRQPSYIHDKRYGVFSNERNIGKSRRGLPYITPLYTKHTALWETDTDASTNRFFRSYVFGQRELHQLLGRPHGFESDEAGGRQGDSSYELSTDQRYKGISQPAITSLHYEPEWNYTLYRNGAQGNQLTNPRSPLTEEVLGEELIAIRDIKSVEHCRAWFDRLQYLIKLHYDAVGDIGEFKSRHTQHVHELFVMFHDALSSFDFQDHYLLDQFAKVRPAELEDLFGIFLEMEGNYMNEDYCPRCSLPTATTRFCGEGDPNTPFRKHRGRWAPHQRWGKEWYEVVVRRAEALWYRSTEDPYFGTSEHTQRQVEGMLAVYVRAKQRAKVVDFLNAIRGSKEFLLGRVTITEAMQRSVDHLLDTTPHQHLLTNAFSVQSKAAIYTGEASKVPHSPLQLRIDLEMQKYRRQQREEGVVRVPPALWKPDTSAMVPYKLDADKRVTNWREVKAGIEQSFLSTGLPKAAYTSAEWREMLYWRAHMARRAERRAAMEAARVAEEAKARAAGMAHVVFPDKDWYRVFETTIESLKPFGLSGGVGTVFTATAQVFPDPAEVLFKDPVSGADMKFDTTDEACALYGDFQSGDVVKLGPARRDGSDDKENSSSSSSSMNAPQEVIIVGVNKAAAESAWTLVAVSAADGHTLVELGTDCVDINDRFSYVENTGAKANVCLVEDKRTAREEFLGQIIGVRTRQLYVQWRLLRGGGSGALDRSVAVCLGPSDLVTRRYTFRELSQEPLVEPSSWRTPFRNAFAEERLSALEKAPFSREQWASLIKGKYTPKSKKFGYTQHSTQDDFETKEYKDRVLGRQFFNDPQAFEVLPERREKSVKFAGKWAYQRTHGLPTVDRNELENGWSEIEPISDEEMQVMEQALKDISGRRPGNFVKAPTETQGLRLNEPWWAPLEFGWEQHNREQRAFLDSSEQRIIDSAKLPFGGKIPPFGTSYGIGERIRDIAADYARGFGLGPHGHSPGHDTSHHNTLGAEEARVRTLGLSNPLVRLFDEKLGNADEHAWALSQCGRDDGNAKQLLLSLHEWREKGRAPSPLLTTVLSRYLGTEVALFNEGLPDGVPRLAVLAEDPLRSASRAARGTGGDSTAVSSSSTGRTRATHEPVVSSSIWVDVDKTRYGLEYVETRDDGDSTDAYILSLVHRANLPTTQAGFQDVHYNNFLQQDITSRFQLELAKLVGRGLPVGFTAQRSADVGRGNARASGAVVPYVRVDELAQLLRRMRVPSERVSLIERGLANCPEHHRLADGNAIAVPISLVLSWGGPDANGGGSTTFSSLGTGGDSGDSNARNSDAVSRAVSASASRSPDSRSGSGSSRSSGDKMMIQVLDELAMLHDGLVMDVRYAIRENRLNPVLRQEFFNAFLPVFPGGHKEVAALYDDYCEGNYVPNITVAIEAFTHFLKNISTSPESIPTDVDYFAVSTSPNRADEYVQLQLLPPTMGPFQYDSTKVEAIETANLFRKYGIIAGPTRVSPTRFITANSASRCYFAHRSGDTVHVSVKNDQGLRTALEQSPHAAVISTNPRLRFLLRSPPAMVAAFNRFFQRVTPMLHFYRALLDEYNATVPEARYAAHNVNRGLAKVLENERSMSIEQDFRRNVERYWRGVLDGRHGDDGAGGGQSSQGSASPQQLRGGRYRDSGSSSHGGGGRTGNQQQQQGQGQGQSQGQSGSAEVLLGRALGTARRQPGSQQQGQQLHTGNSSASSNPAAPVKRSSSLGSVLGVVRKGGVARKTQQQPSTGAGKDAAASSRPKKQ